ncbi:phage tail tip lysozyme [Kribbella sp. NPDC050124]|uniref:phage tail tip lysozyme n=1 Tax=Kribbella sp. NPDC050124 TaxID=3364114 RepID=UPI003795552D
MTASLIPVADQRGRVGPGQVVVDQLALLATHRGTPPALLLRWSAMPTQATVDVVVHLHGFSRRGRSMHLVRDIAPVSGLDLADPRHPSTPGRTRPTLLVLPRGHFHGGKTGRGYSFPALTRPGAVTKLVDEALRRLRAATGVQATRGRLILTAHSGGGAALMAILRHLDPDEVHTFDALYTDPGPLIAWARRHQAAGSGALRVLFRPGEPTARNSLRVAAELGAGSARFRVEQTGVSHMAIPQTYGWRLLADPGADLPGATRPRTAVLEKEAAAGPSLCAAIARVAREQFRRWRPGGGPALTETSPAASPILREYYRVGVGVTVTDAQLQSTAYQAGHPWSAVFISYVMRTAGAGSGFRYSAAHQTYVSAARKNRLANDTSKPFWAYRATELAPRIGDLVCASRSNSGATYDNISDPQTRATHCDVVTEVQPGRIRVIGGNVGQTVGEKWLRTRPDGRLDLTGNQSRFFAVVRCRSDQAATPAPAPAPGSVPATTEGRIARVMELLVRRYGYPVNGAAGLVGNLIAESGVQPNRIEGSNSATPMRARDFSGRIRDFTPDQVRTRSYSRRTGPRHPGIGLAQWTSRDRREGLFRHVYRGRQLGSAILTDLDAQVDYLVTELRGSYRGVNAVLRSPGVTLDQASDAVLLRFERPAAVLNRPVSDPGVQQVLIRRRKAGQQALRTYRASRPN